MTTAASPLDVFFLREQARHVELHQARTPTLEKVPWYSLFMLFAVSTTKRYTYVYSTLVRTDFPCFKAEIPRNAITAKIQKKITTMSAVLVLWSRRGEVIWNIRG